MAVLVGNHILGGGGFTSRLTEEVREKRGLSYSVYSDFSPGLDAGAFTIGLQTRPDQAAEALKVSQDTLRRFVAEGPTEKELKAALDYLEHWTERVQALTVRDVREAMQRMVQPDRMVTVVVGGKQ
jgi:zinc protease